MSTKSSLIFCSDLLRENCFIFSKTWHVTVLAGELYCMYTLTLNEPGYGKTFVDRHPQNFDLGKRYRSYFPADPLHI
jgi:hypothetical protein